MLKCRHSWRAKRTWFHFDSNVVETLYICTKCGAMKVEYRTGAGDSVTLTKPVKKKSNWLVVGLLILFMLIALLYYYSKF